MLWLLLATANAQTWETPGNPWAVGLRMGLGARVMPARNIPDGLTFRNDILSVEIQRLLPDTPYNLPDRIDLQIDWTHLYFTSAGTRWARLPVTAYATWMVPGRGTRHRTLGVGTYVELGRDSFVQDAALTRRPAGTLAAAARIGVEKERVWWDSARVGWHLRAALGVSVAPDPDLLTVTRYARLGVERSWTWGSEDRP